ncbi:MAG TPA: MlaD family protein [Thermoanaerobaculia bacterium]|nr:MlaD family protein [Thermoanaerobaculia bacterium]
MPPRGSEARVGLVILVALAILAAGTFLIGKENNLFTRKSRYFIDFQSVSGIKPGNPVELDGVSVGAVHQVILPPDPSRKFIRVWISVDRRYGERVRADTRARIKTLGLLGDRYVELTSGSPAFPVIPAEGQVPTAPATNVDALIASGEDVMDNVSTISFQLKNILGRIDQGQGLIGELTTNSASGEKMKGSLFSTLDAVNRIANEVEHGDGALPRLLKDRQLADRLAGSVASLESVLATAKTGQGLLPGLLNDPATRRGYDQTIANLNQVAADLRKFTGSLEAGQGLLPRLVNDPQYGQEVTTELHDIVRRLDSVATKLDSGKGTAAQLINDPKIYDAVNDVVVGVNDSWMLRWLIRSRQQAGIKKRYQETVRQGEGAAPASPAPASPTTSPTPPTPPDTQPPAAPPNAPPPSPPPPPAGPPSV